MKPIADSLKVGGVKGLKAYIFPKKKQKKFNIVKRERKRDKVFKNEPSKIYGRQRLTHLKGYGLCKQTISLQIFKRLYSTDFT